MVAELGADASYASVPMVAQPKDELQEVALPEVGAPRGHAPAWIRGHRRAVAGAALAAVGVLALAATSLRPCLPQRGFVSIDDAISAVETGEMTGTEVERTAMAAVDRALSSADIKEAERRMTQAAKFVGVAAAHGKAAQTAKVTGKVVGVAKVVLDLAKVYKDETKIAPAVCTFNVLAAAAGLARAAVTIKEAVSECQSNRPGDLHTRICAVNSGAATSAILRVASMLSSAGSFCAQNLNVDAICSAAITGLISLLAEGATSAAISLKTCSPKSPLPEGGNPGTLGEFLSADGNISAPPRRLWLGGGEEAMTTECVLDVNQASFALALAGLYITKAQLADCKQPPWLPEFAKELLRTKCAQDISLVLAAFAQAASFLSLTATHCTMSINNGGLCAAGISGVVAALGGIATSGAAMHLTCKEFQGPLLKAASHLLPPIRRLDGTMESIHQMPELEGLNEAHADELWQRIGFDMSDKNAWWRSEEFDAAELKPEGVMDHIRELAQPAQASNGKLVASPQQCRP